VPDPVRPFDIAGDSPTQEQIQAEYEAVWRPSMGARSSSVIDLPMMTDPEVQAVMQVLSILGAPAYLTDFRLCCLLICRTGKACMRMARGAFRARYAYLGNFLGPSSIVIPTVIVVLSLHAPLWKSTASSPTRPRFTTHGKTSAGLDPANRDRNRFHAATFRAAIETGDLAFACYGMSQPIKAFLLPERSAGCSGGTSPRIALDLCGETPVLGLADIIRSQQTLHRKHAGSYRDFSNPQ